jgi:putative Ca2+/H+ antiporter (TMEM165/GDT1 family)
MSISNVLRAFAAVFLAELPDKTMVATIVLVARYRRPLWVWLGAAAAFSVHVAIAVLAGGLLGLLPDTVVSIAVATMFAVGAVLLFRQARDGGDEPETQAEATRTDRTARAAVVGSFGLIVLAEWGDLTQLATASLTASTGEPWSIALGALLALASVSAIAATFGRQLVRRVPIHVVNYAGATVFALLAAWTVAELVR